MMFEYFFILCWLVILGSIFGGGFFFGSGDGAIGKEADCSEQGGICSLYGEKLYRYSAHQWGIGGVRPNY